MKYHVYHPEAEGLEGEADAEDYVMRPRHPDGAVGLEDPPGLPEPAHVEAMVLLEAAEGAVPDALVHGSETAALYGGAAGREPVGRVREDCVYAPGRHQAHQRYAVGQVDDGARFAEGLEVS